MQPSLRDTPLATEREPKQTRMSRDLFPRENLLHCGISIRPLSALGQERTSHVHLAMSALPPKADIARPASRCPFSARISQCRRRGDQFVGTGHVLWYHVMAG